MHRPRDVAQIVDPLIEEQIGPDMSASRLESHDGVRDRRSASQSAFSLPTRICWPKRMTTSSDRNTAFLSTMNRISLASSATPTAKAIFGSRKTPPRTKSGRHTQGVLWSSPPARSCTREPAWQSQCVRQIRNEGFRPRHRPFERPLRPIRESRKPPKRDNLRARLRPQASALGISSCCPIALSIKEGHYEALSDRGAIPGHGIEQRIGAG